MKLLLALCFLSVPTFATDEARDRFAAKNPGMKIICKTTCTTFFKAGHVLIMSALHGLNEEYEKEIIKGYCKENSKSDPEEVASITEAGDCGENPYFKEPENDCDQKFLIE
jgi:hypothetical protein